MNKKIFNFIGAFLILISFVSTTLLPVEVFAATTKTPAKTTTKKTVAKKKVAKKKVTKKKERLIINPPLITLDTAPHSPKPVAKKKTTKKVVAKKKA